MEYKCDTKEDCPGTVVTEWKSITGLPNVLVIHLKRFSYAMEDGRFVQKKHTGAVRIPKDLDVAQFCSENVRTPANVDASISSDSPVISAPVPSGRKVKRRIVCPSRVKFDVLFVCLTVDVGCFGTAGQRRRRCRPDSSVDAYGVSCSRYDL